MIILELLENCQLALQIKKMGDQNLVSHTDNID